MRRSALFLLFLYTVVLGIAHAQVAESADKRGLRIDAGGLASGFDPGEGGNKLVGAGTYVDVHFSHWFQIEAEGRWLYWNQYYGEHESNYLIGPRVPIRRWGKWNTYGKALIGQARMTFPFGYGYGSFTDLAFGGTVDYRLSRKLTVRAADFEYQYWPKWINNQTLSPYGLSVGMAYRVF